MPAIRDDVGPAGEGEPGGTPRPAPGLDDDRNLPMHTTIPGAPGSYEWLTDQAHPDRWTAFLAGYQSGVTSQDLAVRRRFADAARLGEQAYGDGLVQGRQDRAGGVADRWVARDLGHVLARAQRRGTLADLADRYRDNPGPFLEALEAVQRLIEDEAYREESRRARGRRVPSWAECFAVWGAS